MNYRPEIDGLRALAILPVLFFHADFAWMPGGFLGVDIFFVISGYLITSILIKEKTEQRFHLASFYERRARRILPALLFVLVFSSLAAWFILSPSALVDYTKSLMAVLSFVANIYFWYTTNYFDVDTAFKPLLHTWSLGIEEQFYFILPWLLIWGWATQKRLIYGLVFLFISSLLAAQLLPLSYHSANFYLLPTRAWELLAGTLVAFFLQGRHYRSSHHTHQLGSALGLLLVLGSFFLFNTDLHHPSLLTLIPVMGTVLLLIYAQPYTYVARVLSLRPLVWIGLLSYSAYLWHQPLFAFSRHLYLNKALPLAYSLLLIAITFVASYCSWRWIEHPFRNRAFLRRRTIFAWSLGTIALAWTLGLLTIYHNGFKQRFSQTDQQIMQFANYDFAPFYRENTCFLNEHQTAEDFAEPCLPSAVQPKLIWGDSHAAALSYGLRELDNDWAQLTASGCPPLVNTHISWRPHCAAINERIQQYIAQEKPTTVLLHANWKTYELDDLTVRLAATLAQLQELSPASQIVVVGDIPQWQPSLIEQLRHAPQFFVPNSRLHNSSLASTRTIDQQLQAAQPPVFLSLEHALCQEEACLAVIADKQNRSIPLVWDYGHLTAAGSLWLAKWLQPRF